MITRDGQKCLEFSNPIFLKICLFFWKLEETLFMLVCEHISKHVKHWICNVGSMPRAFWQYIRREPHELFLTKGVPLQISTGLEILRKFMRIINCKLIVIACNCIITGYSFLTIGDIVIFNNLIFCKRFVFSAPSWLEKEEQLSWLGKNEHLFENILCPKKENVVVVRLHKVV